MAISRVDLAGNLIVALAAIKPRREQSPLEQLKYWSVDLQEGPTPSERRCCSGIFPAGPLEGVTVLGCLVFWGGGVVPAERRDHQPPDPLGLWITTCSFQRSAKQ